MGEVFVALDVRQTGELDIDEFCGGVWNVAVSASPIEMKRLEALVHSIRLKLDEQVEVMAEFLQHSMLLSGPARSTASELSGPVSAKAYPMCSSTDDRQATSVHTLAHGPI